MPAKPKVMVIGLDCAPPAFVFDRYQHVMPNVTRLMRRGAWGPMRSCVPPITVPAWTCMVSGRDAGELGLYGFRNRDRGGYGMRIPNSDAVREKRLWDWLSEAGLRVAPMFVPLTWPPPAVRGVSVSCFLTPGPESAWTFPPGLATALETRFGAYRADVVDRRNGDPVAMIEEIYAMGRQHFAMAEHVWTTEQPDFLMMVEMGPDRFHHGFYAHMDVDHPKHDPNDPLAAEGERYYAFLDAEVGKLVAAAGEDTTVLIVSDHGARPLLGGVHVNEWLIQEGWLVLHEAPAPHSPVTPDMVDWSRTRAWGEGGYYARIWLNIEGRDPEGIVSPAEAVKARAQIAAGLRALALPHTDRETRVVFPEDEYRETRGVPPDLMVFFGDLAYRALGSVGTGQVFSETNDTGPDSCNHDWDGIFVMAGGGAEARGMLVDLTLYDVAKTVLSLFHVPIPDGLLGRDRSRG